MPKSAAACREKESQRLEQNVAECVMSWCVFMAADCGMGGRHRDSRYGECDAVSVAMMMFAQLLPASWSQLPDDRQILSLLASARLISLSPLVSLTFPRVLLPTC